MSKKSQLIEHAGFAENVETGVRGVLLVIQHPNAQVCAAAASYLIEVVGPNMEKGLPAIDALFAAMQGGKSPEDAAADAAADAARAMEADAAAERINEAEPTPEARAAGAEAIERAMRAGNPGSGKVQ